MHLLYQSLNALGIIVALGRSVLVEIGHRVVEGNSKADIQQRAVGNGQSEQLYKILALRVSWSVRYYESVMAHLVLPNARVV